MLPGEAAKEDRYLVPLFGGEGPLDRTVIVPGLVVEARDLDQPLPFRRDRLHQLLLQGKRRTREVGSMYPGPSTAR